MRKQEAEALRRLEQALLEDTEPTPPEADSPEWVEDFYEETEGSGFTVQNTDDTDVDPDSYSEAVYAPKRGGCLVPGLVTLLALSLLTVMVLWLLKYLGVM